MASEPPLILAFDTAAAHCAAALVRGDAVLARRDEPMDRGQAERLLPMLEEMLAEAGVALGATSTAIARRAPAPATSPASASPSPRPAASRWRSASRRSGSAVFEALAAPWPGRCW